MGHVAGADAGRGRTKVDTTPRYSFLDCVWQPRRAGAAVGPGRARRPPAAFLGAVAGRVSESGLAIVVAAMEDAPAGFGVPLKIEIRTARTWAECK